MNIVATRPKQSRRHHTGRWFSVGLLIILIAGGITNFSRPVPASNVESPLSRSYPATAVNLPWPGFGQSALMTSTGELLGTSGAQTPLATASIAKVITALCVLQKYPLTKGAAGPTVTLTERDVALYNSYVSKDGSVVAVHAGDQFTEYQLLQAILLPSANNIADSTAIWAFGSLDAYITYANQYVQSKLLANTKIAVDASGFDGATTSTATDLVHIGQLALTEPALADIVSQPSAQLPTVGTIYNYNGLLGNNDVVGIKTGNNDQDPGAILFATKQTIDGHELSLIGAVMGASSLGQALRAVPPILQTASGSFSVLTALPSDYAVGKVTTSWGATANIVASKDLTTLRWQGDALNLRLALPKTVSPGTTQLSDRYTARLNGSASSATVSLKLDKPLTAPSFWWRLTRH